MAQATDTSFPLVDVVMITYNQQDYIAEGIRGVVKQKGNFRLRLIIMDDCSSDRTYEIAKHWENQYPDIITVYKNKQNLGLLRNYIEGFRRCDGDYLAVCDADDYWFDSHKLNRQISYMEQHPECAITFHRVVNLYQESGEKSLSNGGQRVDTTIVDLAKSNYITNLSVVYRRRYVDFDNLPEWVYETPVPDYAFHMLYAMHGTIRYFKRPMGVYRQLKSATWSLAGRYDRLKISLITRYNLIMGLKDMPEEATQGLLKASENILKSMYSCSETAEQLNYVKEKAAKLDIELPQSPSSVPLPKRKLLTRLRAAVSRLVPCPHP